MKPLTRQDHVKLKKALASAYRNKENADVGDVWQVRAMGHIRSLGHPYSSTSYLELFQRFIWQLAPLAFILVVLLGIVVSKIDFVSGYEIAKMFIDDPADFSLLALYI